MIRAGLGFDAHVLDASRTLIVGGVEIPDVPGLSGHSDADVLSHAVADAVLGAAGLGDLGEIFPQDERWRDASSIELLKIAGQGARDAGWMVGNVDATVIAQTFRVAPYRGEMIANIARALGIETGRVSIKATTTDGLGFTGRGEGVAAMAVVLLERPQLDPTTV